MKLQQQKNGQYSLTISQDIIRGFGWQKGDPIDFKIIGAGELKLFKKK